MFKKFGKFFLFLFLCSFANATQIDIDKLLIQAKSQNKYIMFFHHVPGCPYCKAMLDENFKDQSILKEIDDNFIYVDIYTADTDMITFKEFKGDHREFSYHIGAKAFPATVFMNPKGEVIHIAIGYRNIDEHLIDMTYISTHSYKTMKFQSYKEKVEFERD